MREHLPETAPLLESIAAAYGTPEFDEVFRALYPKCENISVDYAVLEPRSAKGEHLSHLYCLPAEFSWNDLGSWASLYEYQLETRLRGDAEGNVADTGGHMAIEANDNYIFSPKKFVAMVGVENLVSRGHRGCAADCAPRPLPGRGQDREGAERHGAHRPDLKLRRIRERFGGSQVSKVRPGVPAGFEIDSALKYLHEPYCPGDSRRCAPIASRRGGLAH